MIGLDTNVLVRYITRDNEQQWQKAVEIIESGQQCFIANIVLCELVWVLRGKPYQFSKDEILKTLEVMMQSADLKYENRTAVYQALQHTKQGRGDFSDYLIGTVARQLGCQEIVTFDKKLNGESGFQLLLQSPSI
ncbi:PIN domain-containing protein [Aliterella atlantica]|nr:type II toxin-antitoxin system VapC family toxin [Aliterella atlantica]